MEITKHKPNLNSFPSSPLPNPPSSSSIFRDISNFATPKQPSKAPDPSSTPKFFTASKNTPQSYFRRSSVKPSAVKSKAARRLKTFELEQSKSARKAQYEKEKSLKSLAQSLSVWLNFLFENPSSCGCDRANFTGEIDGSDLSLRGNELLMNNGKRTSGSSCGVGVDGPWRGPKRQRDLLWSDESGQKARFLDSRFSGLKASLQEICSFKDLKERMRMYMNLDTCADVFEAMAQVTKNIDEGRLRMRTSCPIVSDVGMKEKAIRILMCYNPIWLRIGLYILLGGESLLPDGGINSDQETTFLKMIIEKQLLSHPDLAKAYAYNKMVEGLYRPGYYEKLGNVILKRFFLLVIILDRAKSHTSLPLKYGIDGLDGGSPLLLSVTSNIKSSRQVVIDFLSSEVMHGEGNLLAHLAIVGYKVTYQQNPLIEYEFKVTDLFDDLKDGVLICRAIQLLKHDSSILMKVVVPSDTRKKNLVNCDIALQYLKQAGVPLTDEDGTEVIAEDLVNGDKELTLALLWNMFVHLQLPLLLSRKILSEEISNVQGGVLENSSPQTLLELLLSWIQAVCETYEFKVESRSSLLDGKAMWCLLDYYFRKEQDCSCSFKDPDGTKGEVSIMSAIEYTDAVHNFLLTQKLTSLLGNFPEVLQVSDILEDNGACNAQTVIVLLVFLSVQLLVKRNTDKLNFHKLLGFTCQSSSFRRLSTERNSEQGGARDFKVIMAWWQDMAQQNGKSSLKPAPFSAQSFSTGRGNSNIQRENAATLIQSHFRRFLKRRDYRRIIDAALILQIATLSWLSVKDKVSIIIARGKGLEKFRRYVTFMTDRHYFVKLKKSTITIQHATRAWISRRHYIGSTSSNQWALRKKKDPVIPEEDRMTGIETEAVIKIQHSWRKFIFCKSIKTQHSAATKIQSHYRGWLVRKSFACKKQAIRTIKRNFLCLKSRKNFQSQVENMSAIIIQSHVRGWLARRKIYREKHLFTILQRYCRSSLQTKELLFRAENDAAKRIQNALRSMNLHRAFISQRDAASDIQCFIRGGITRKRLQVEREIKSAIVIQSQFRGWKIRKMAKREKERVAVFQKENDAARTIQSAFHCMNLYKAFISQRNAATDIQCFARGEVARKRLLGASSCSHKTSNRDVELKIFIQSVVKLQRWWRGVLEIKRKNKSAIVIQSYFRGWAASKMAKRENECAVLIQSYWKGYLARKIARGQLLDLRMRMQKSAANVDDNKRLINRLVAALSELLNMRSISGVLHTCATLDVATELSQRCCEELVAAGAIGTLLKLIRSVSRSIPDQQVLKHALSTLRNLARYPHLIELLVDSHGCVETFFLEFHKNKEEGYFIACDLLKKICLSEKGVTNIRKSSAILKRLKNLVEELGRKVGNDRRNNNARNLITREHAERRLREAAELLQLITTNA